MPISNWRDHILTEFTPKVARLTLVSDPDGLLLEEGILAGILQRGFELIPFEDPVAFRYAYESGFRSRWDRGEQPDLVVVLHSGTTDLGSLPYDLLQAGRRLSFNLGEIFPNLSYPIVAALDRGDLDALYEAQKRCAPGVLGDNATKEFVLRHVFEITPQLVRTPVDLLRVLLRRHYRKQRIPPLLDERFIQVLRRQGIFEEWPLESIIPDREVFFSFLQERWPIFLNRSAKQESSGVREHEEPLDSSYPVLRICHSTMTTSVSTSTTSFSKDFWKPFPMNRPNLCRDPGLPLASERTTRRIGRGRIDSLLDTLASAIPNQDARHDDWFHFAGRWAELVSLALDPDAALAESVGHKMGTLQARIDNSLVSWLSKRYAGLVNLPPVPAVMLHHIPRFLSRHVNDAQQHKVALVLVDGLSLNQWIVLRKELARQSAGLRFRENAVFAWIPTITSVSRQAAFAGKPPLYFPNSIHTTDKEPTLWTQFWVDQGLPQQEVAYAKGLGDGALDSVEEIVARPKTRVVGLVVDKVDKIMHGMELGAAGMHNQVRQWAAQPFMTNLVDLLLENGFRVCLTSDHGNIEAAGCGRLSEGAVADLRGRRIRIYPDSSLRRQTKKRFPGALEWPPIGLPDNYWPLLATERSAFVREKERLVCHGGASLEELIVPLVQIERRGA